MGIFDILKSNAEEVKVKEIKKYTDEELQKMAEKYELELDKMEYKDMIKLNDRLADELERIRDQCSVKYSVELQNVLLDVTMRRYATAMRLRKISFFLDDED